MSAKLDWQIESDRTEERADSDPQLRRQRRRKRLTILLVTFILITALVGAVGAVALRLTTIDNTLRQGLINAAHAEVMALQLGDRDSFDRLMRSQDADWINAQDQRFDRYQALKASQLIQFSDTIADSNAIVDGYRGRVLVDETIKGQAYRALWYFWRYPDGGWQHVPSDLTFWGDPAQIVGKVTTVKYDGLDAPLATALADDVDRWWAAGCQYLACAEVPRLTVQIQHQPASFTPAWDSHDPLALNVNSPLTVGDHALATALPSDLETAVAGQIANKLFDQASGQLNVNPNADASWLRQSLIDWLNALLLGRGNLAQLAFMQSIADHYGGSAGISAIVQQMTPNSTISVVATALKQPLDSLNVDWKSFFQWRLGLEKDLIQGKNQAAYLTLWDETAPGVSALAREHFGTPIQALPQVQSVSIARDSALGMVATVPATSGGQTLMLRFRVINGTWKRIA
jgi:hypothetical protein